MANFIRGKKKGSGARCLSYSGTGGNRFANTQHLKRILMFLREKENKGKYFTRTDFVKCCCTNGFHVTDALKFLLREGFAVQTWGTSHNNRTTKYFGIKKNE